MVFIGLIWSRHDISRVNTENTVVLGLVPDREHNSYNKVTLLLFIIGMTLQYSTFLVYLWNVILFEGRQFAHL